MGLMGLNKGKRGEREVVQLLQPVVNAVYSALGREPPVLQRNTLQSDRGGYDIVGLDWLAPEVKRCETLNLSGWWQQCKEQARPGQTPVLFYRKNGTKWRVRMVGSLKMGYGDERLAMLVEVSVDDFLRYFKRRLEHRLEGTGEGIGDGR